VVVDLVLILVLVVQAVVVMVDIKAVQQLLLELQIQEAVVVLEEEMLVHLVPVVQE